MNAVTILCRLAAFPRANILHHIQQELAYRPLRRRQQAGQRAAQKSGVSKAFRMNTYKSIGKQEA
jgi:hypothetical protein